MVSKTVRSWILGGILFISVISSLMHFVYAWSGSLAVIGVIAPINESIWEHLKMAFWPMLLWWCAGYLILEPVHKIRALEWFFAAIIALFICPLFIATFYYTYTGALGIHSLALDILSLFLGVILAQTAALHILNYAKVNKLWFYTALAALSLLTVAFIIFTFSPPQLPLFLDRPTGTYGLQRL